MCIITYCIYIVHISLHFRPPMQCNCVLHMFFGVIWFLWWVRCFAFATISGIVRCPVIPLSSVAEAPAPVPTVVLGVEPVPNPRAWMEANLPGSVRRFAPCFPQDFQISIHFAVN